MRLVHTSGCAHFSIRPDEAVETCGRNANGGRDLLPLDCGPGVHLSHISQVPGTEADSVLSNKDSSISGVTLQHAAAAWGWGLQIRMQVYTRLGPKKSLVRSVG